jgi:signal transduction histidine kinase/ligand-binding sensor domain-containing protein/DNA-binding response OmpR family regulator
MKLTLKVLFFVKLAIFCLFNIVYASYPEQYKFKLINASTGLNHNQINCFFQDSKGFIWIGTAAGLNRFDGSQVKSFRPNSKDSLSLSGNIIDKIFEDPEGKIWVKSRQGLDMYDPLTENFYKNFGEYRKKYNLPESPLENIVKDNLGTFWFISQDRGITRYSPDTKVSKTIYHESLDPSSLGSNSVSMINFDSKGHIWIIHTNGLLERMNPNSLQVEERIDYIMQKNNNQNLSYNFLIDRDDDLWIYHPIEKRGAYYYSKKEKNFIPVNKESGSIKLNNNLISGVVEDSKGLIWLGTDHGGLNIINKKDFSVQYILHDSDIANSLEQNSINSLYKDNRGIIWVGTFKKGVNYFHESIIRFQHFKYPVSLSGSVPYNDVNVFVEDPEGNLWIGTDGAGLLHFNRLTNRFTQYKHNPTDPNSLSSNVIVSMIRDNENNLWIGTYYGGLNKFDGKHFKRFKHDANDPFSISEDNVWELLEDSKGNIWVGTIREGLNRYDKKDNSFYKYKPAAGEYNIKFSYIAAIAEDLEGNIWIGGTNGINIINSTTGKVKTLSYESGNPSSLPSDFVYSIFRSKDGSMWIGSQGGLSYYNSKSNCFVTYNVEDGLSHNIVVSIQEDEYGNLWLGTPNGLSNFIWDGADVIKKANFNFKNYDETYGLQGKVFNENAVLRTRNQELVFGGVNGFNIFKPDNISKNTEIPSVILTDFQLFNKSVFVGKESNGRIILEKSISEIDDLVLKPGENVFSIEFAAINFFHPERNLFKYKLEGFDHEWLFTDNNNKRATYTNLNPGEYSFVVLAANNDGVWNQEGRRLKIIVLAPWYKTSWAYILYGLLFLTFIYVIRNRLIRKAEIKFQIEQERFEAKQLHELDMMKIKFLTNLSHEFRTPLSLIIAPVEKLLSLVENPEQKKQFEMINKNARRLLNLVNQLLDFRKIEMDGAKYHPSEGNIIKFIEATVKSFADLAEQKEINLIFQSELKEFYTSFDMDKLEKVLFNLLSNAIKFTHEAGLIEVHVKASEPQDGNIQLLEIKVVDNGIGISNEKIHKVFQRFYKEDVPTSMVSPGSGIGLSIVKEYVKIHCGTITLESELGKGSCFTIMLPLKILKNLSLEKQNKNFANVIEGPIVNHDTQALEKEGSLVLLVEDNEDFRAYLRENLEHYYKIIEAKNGKEGWQKALSTLPDLIVSDLMMPELDGIELCKKIKQDTRTCHIPFVLLTAHSAEEQKLKGLNTGANDYITKPFNFQLLNSRMKNLIEQRKQFQRSYEKKISVETSQIEIISLDDKLIQKAIKVVEDNLSDPDFSVEIMSKELGLSRVHLYKKMMALTAMSPVEFIRKIRIQRASQLLEKSQLSVAEVAFKVGFNNPKYFTKYFKEEFNVLPSTYSESKSKGLILK